MRICNARRWLRPSTTIKIESRFTHPPAYEAAAHAKIFLQFVKMKWNQRINITFTSNGPVKDNGAEGEDDPDHKAPDIKMAVQIRMMMRINSHGIAKFKTGLGIVGDGDKSHVQHGL